MSLHRGNLLRGVGAGLVVFFAGSCAWAVPWLLYSFDSLEELNPLAPLIVGSLLAGGLANAGHLFPFPQLARAPRLLAAGVAGWAIAFIAGSVWMFFLFITLFGAGMFSSGTEEDYIHALEALPPYVALGGAVGGLILGICDWLKTRRVLPYSWIMVPATVGGWYLGWSAFGSLAAQAAAASTLHLHDPQSVGIAGSLMSGALASLPAATLVALLLIFADGTPQA